MLDIYLLTEGHSPLFAIDKDTNPLCIVGANIQEVLTNIYHEAETAALLELNRHTMQDVINHLLISDKMRHGRTNPQ
jgi:DNA-binding IscR family transcriptional regulator